MIALTNATYRALLADLLEIGVENSYDNLPDCTNTTGHDWQLRENVTATVDWGDGVLCTETFPWAIQCAHCGHACCLR